MKKQPNAMDKAKEAARDREIAELLANVKTARFVIMEQIEERGQKKANVTGQVPCPICELGTVSYSRAGRYNGHITAKCSTAGCVEWIE